MRRRLAGYLFILPYLFVFIPFVVLPLFIGMSLGFFQWEMLSPVEPRFVGLQQIRLAFNDPYFWNALKATSLFVLFCVPMTVILSLTIALGLHAIKQRQSIYRSIFVLPMMVNITVVGLLWRWMLNTDFGVFNGYLKYFGIQIPWTGEPGWAMLSIIMLTLWWGIGAPTIILLAGLKHIPKQYYEAAKVDGANSVRRFVSVTLPLLKPSLVFVLVTQLIASFQIFGQTFIVTKGGPNNSTRVLMHHIYETSFVQYRIGYGAAMSMLLFLVIVVITLIQYFLVKER
ncbi:sugar ABC transporter permease [Planctomycetota bacterium]|nr:sugar ABC transporter permease [Planctomycetota bacterium]